MAEIVKMPKIDKSEWGDGPWQSEPDKLNWEHAGLDCMIVRHTSLGHLCGYVGVPQGHPDFQTPYDDVDVRVHGGLTYANECHGHICHVPKSGRPANVWWLGFDCAHCDDQSPANNKWNEEHDFHSIMGEYRDIDYVRAETNRLADQLSERLHNRNEKGGE